MTNKYYDDDQKALAKAYRYLTRRDHSRRELELKLKSKGFSFSAIKNALDELESRNLLNNAEFARMFVRHCQVYRKLGPAAIRAELAVKGISGTQADEALKEYSQELEWENLQALAEKALSTGKTALQAFGYLQRRGYDFSSIRRILSTLYDDSGDNSERKRKK